MLPAYLYPSLKLTTNDIQCAQGHVREAVEALFVVDFLLQSLHQHGTLLLEDVDKVVQDFEMECRREDLPTGVPFLALAGQEPGAEPWLQELVIVTLFDVTWTAENWLEVEKVVMGDL